MKSDGEARHLLTVVVPTYRRPAHIARLLRDLVPQARTTGTAIIVVNDGSHDAAYAAALAPYGDAVRYEILERNLGRGGATNHGIAQADGEWIVFTDDDVAPPPDWLETLLAIIARYPSLDVVGGTTRAIPHEGEGVVERFTVRRDVYVPQPHFTNGTLKCLVTACLAVRRSVLDAVGGLDGSFPCGQDHNLTWRLRRHGAAIHVTHRWWCGHDQAWTLGELTGRLREYAYWHVVQADISRDPVDYEANPATSWGELLRRLPPELAQLRQPARYAGLSFLDRQRFRFLDLASFLAWNRGGVAAAKRLGGV